MDFASVNLSYLLALRELAQREPDLAGVIAGVPDELTNALAELGPERLMQVAASRVPLFRPRGDPAWWDRLAEAARDGKDEEFADLLDHDLLRSKD